MLGWMAIVNTQNMNLTKFNAPFNKRLEEITLIQLTDDEWLSFLRNLANSDVTNLKHHRNININDIEVIDSTRCVALCPNESFIRRYGADTRLVSVITEGYGEIHLRLWFAENGVKISLNKVMEEVFPGGLPEEVLVDFWKWWSNFPMEPQAVGSRIITKQRKEFGIGHLAAWIQHNLNNKDKKPPQIAWQNFLFNLRPFMYANELYILWVEKGIINNDSGRLSPIHELQK